MMKKATVFLGLMVLFITIHSPAKQEEPTLSLSLEECIMKAVKNNLGVAIDVLDPELAALGVSLANEKFLPQLSFGFDRNHNISASYSWLEAAGETITDYTNLSAEISQLIPTGGSFNINLSGNKYDTNRRAQIINPRYGTTLRLDFNQPLLKDFGFKISRREIIVAQNNQDISENTFKRALQETIYSVEEAYWNLVSSIETLNVRKQSLKLAQDFLERQKRAVEIGTEAQIEILSAQSEVASREADILESEAAVKNNEDILKTILNLSVEREDAELLQIVPTDTPAFERKEVSLDDALMTAMKNRPDLEATRMDLKNREIDVNYNKNQLLPDLRLNASYWSPGVSGTQLIYQGGNALTGIIIDTIPGGASDALKDTFGFKFNNWRIGLSLNIPLDTVFSRASYAQSKVNMEQAMLRLKNQEQQIFLEIKQAVRAVETNFKRVQAYKIARELQQKTLEAEEEKFKVGLSTPYQILQYQRDLANSQNQELRAVIDYNLSLARLSRALGTSLEEKNVSISQMMD
jgi:outer membrane protein TolC